jgi:hypothetical protein
MVLDPTYAVLPNPTFVGPPNGCPHCRVDPREARSLDEHPIGEPVPVEGALAL